MHENAIMQMLEDMGATNIEHDYENVYFDIEDGYTYECSMYNIAPDMTLEQILRYALLKSPCCGEYMYEDLMLCPICKEHC